MSKYSHILIKPETKENLRISSFLSGQNNIECLDEAVRNHLSKLMDIRKMTTFDLKKLKLSRK